MKVLLIGTLLPLAVACVDFEGVPRSSGEVSLGMSRSAALSATHAELAIYDVTASCRGGEVVGGVEEQRHHVDLEAPSAVAVDPGWHALAVTVYEDGAHEDRVPVASGCQRVLFVRDRSHRVRVDLIDRLASE